MISIILAIVIVNIVILAHEYGHYYFAKKYNCAVLEFSIGIGPKLFSFRKRETLFCFRLFPVLGYVRMLGESEFMPGEDERDKETLSLIKKLKLVSLENLTLGKKILVLFGGIFNNLLLALCLSYLIVLLCGVPKTELIIMEIVPNSPAEIAGLKAGDKITAIQKQTTDSAQRFLEILGESGNKSVVLTIIRNNYKKEIAVLPKYSSEERKRLIGVKLGESLTISKEKTRPSDYFMGGSKMVWQQIALTFNILANLFTGKVSLDQLTGVIGIVGVTSSVIKIGDIISLFFLLSLINVNLAIINALPFPMLDGFACLIAIIESLSGKRISPKTKELIQNVGIILLLLLFLFITFSDIKRIYLAGHHGPIKSNQIK